MEIFSGYEQLEKAQSAFADYYAEAYNDIRERIVRHFRGDDWSNEQAKEIIGESISVKSSVNQCSLYIYERVDEALKTRSSEFTIQRLIDFAKEAEIDITGLRVPYKMIILCDSEENLLEDYDDTEPLLENEIELNNNLDKYVVCHDKQELIDAWTQLKDDYEGAWYGIKDADDKLLLGGAYDPDDISWIENYPDYQSYYHGYIFIYDSHGGDEELNPRTGETAEIIRPLTSKEADLEYSGNMYKVRFLSDGYETDVFEDEIKRNDELSKQLRYAYDITKSLNNNFARFSELVNSKTGKVTGHAVYRKDPSIEGVYEIWIKIGADENCNGGKIAGKIFNICSVEELADVRTRLKEGTAVVTTNKGKKMPVNKLLEKKAKEREVNR